jgi:hypothetical protein
VAEVFVYKQIVILIKIYDLGACRICRAKQTWPYKYGTGSPYVLVVPPRSPVYSASYELRFWRGLAGLPATLQSNLALSFRQNCFGLHYLVMLHIYV